MITTSTIFFIKLFKCYKDVGTEKAHNISYFNPKINQIKYSYKQSINQLIDGFNFTQQGRPYHLLVYLARETISSTGLRVCLIPQSPLASFFPRYLTKNSCTSITLKSRWRKFWKQNSGYGGYHENNMEDIMKTIWRRP